MDRRPGRSCPIAYRYAPESLDRSAQLATEVLYVVGGLYGNEAALQCVLDLAAAETAPHAIVFNGDFNWFNADDAGFFNINRRVLQHWAIRGNVETELLQRDQANGCGCAYPDEVSDQEVARSNAIMDQLREVAARLPKLAGRVAALPTTLLARVGRARIGIVHGDAESLAGWAFGAAALHTTLGALHAARLLERAQVDIFASSHTCLPVLRPLSSGVIINNGAAGMPNFCATRFGVVTRISMHPARKELRLYGTKRQDVFIDALRLDFDHAEFARAFQRRWPSGSAAHQSYFERIIAGPGYTVEDAINSSPILERKVCAA
jgi:hypothetical protein